MRIESIQIENFGNHSHRTIGDLSNRLNIVQAADDETRNSAFQFVRWMLFGNCDESSSLVVGRTGTTPAGSITVMQDGQRRTVSRRDDGTRYGRVAVDGADRFSPQTNHMVSLLGTVTQPDFDHFFAPRFTGESYIHGLTQAARNHGIEFISRSVPSDRRHVLLRRIEQIRLELGQHRPWDETWASLRERHRVVVDRIEMAELDLVRRRGELEVELRRIRDELVRVHAEIDVCRERWRLKDEELEARRVELERVWHEAERARGSLRHKLEAESNELDALVARWRGFVDEMRRRCDWLAKVLQESEDDLGQDDRTDRCHVASIAAGLERLRSDLTTWNSYTRRSESEQYDWRSVRERVAQGLDELRNLTSGVCETLREQRDHDRFRILHEELDQLQFCEMALARWLETVERQRDQLANDLAAANRNETSLVWADGMHEHHGRHYRWDDPHATRHRSYGTMRAVLHACDGFTPIDPHADRMLRDLTEQRDTLARELNRVQDRSRELHARQVSIEAELARITDRTIDELRRELAEIERRLIDAERWDALESELRRLELEERSLPNDVVVSPVIEHASDLLQQLSDGQLQRLYLDGATVVSATDRTGVTIAWHQLGEDQRQQIQLALCLACVAAMRRKGIELPLLLVDVAMFERALVDRHQIASWVAVLSHFASAGHQVLLFTRRVDLPELFATREYRLIVLDRMPVVERPVVPPAAPAVDHVRFKRRPTMELDWPSRDDDAWEAPRPVRRETNRETTRETVVRPVVDRGEGEPLNVIHWETMVDRAHTIDNDAGRALRAAGIKTVRQFLEADEMLIEDQLQAAGVTARPIRRWQDELELACWLRDLPVEDARVLVACGINDVGELADADANSLYNRMTQYVAANGDVRRSTRPLSMELVVRWIDAARYCRQSWNGSRRREGVGAPITMPITRRDAEPADRRTFARDNDHRSRNDERPARGDANEARARRRRARDGYAANNGSGSSAQAGTGVKHELRFYLNLEDPVVDAPAIGPRVANQLAEVGVRTVRELLEANADNLAERLGSRRTSAATIRQWQSQATLACRVPELRGHDAQILVACDVTEPGQLAAMDENELWSRVRPFIRTSEGKRILRGGKLPDLEEVRQWIQWARNARTLRAA